jgi:hypothetical protein
LKIRVLDLAVRRFRVADRFLGLHI